MRVKLQKRSQSTDDITKTLLGAPGGGGGGGAGRERERERERERGGREGEGRQGDKGNKNNVYMSRRIVDIGSFDYFKN